MGIWCWLGTNSSQIQALAGVMAVVVGIAVGWVAWKQKRAAEAQATAAVRQTAAAEIQAEAAREQVIAAKQQAQTSLLIADKQTSPNISLTGATTRDGIVMRQSIAILNNGNGPALNLELKYNDGFPGNDALGISGKTLVPRDSLSAYLNEVPRAASPGLRLTYETIFGTKYILEFQWNGVISRAVNEKLSVQS